MLQAVRAHILAHVVPPFLGRLLPNGTGFALSATITFPLLPAARHVAGGDGDNLLLHIGDFLDGEVRKKPLKQPSMFVVSVGDDRSEPPNSSACRA